jgi:transposase-like protein
MKESYLQKLKQQYRLRDKTYKALKLVLVDGRSWRDAERTTGVARSTIFRSLQRIGILKKVTHS